MKTYIIMLYCLYLVFGIYKKTHAQDNPSLYPIKINVQYEKSQPGDTLILTFTPQQFYGQRVSESHISIVGKDGFARFDFVQPYPYGYLSIERTKLFRKWDYPALAKDLFWEAGDVLHMSIKDPIDIEHREYIYDTQFSGNGAIKYETLYKIRRKNEAIMAEMRKNKVISHSENNIISPNYQDSKDKLLSILDNAKNDISPFGFDVLKTDISMTYIGTEGSKFLAETMKRDFIGNQIDTVQQNLMRNHFLPIRNYDYNPRAMAASGEFIRFYRNLFNYLDRSTPESRDMSIARDIVINSTGILREALLMAYLDLISITPKTKIVSDFIFGFLKDNYYKNEYFHLKSKSNISINAYQMEDINGNKINLSRFNGKILLLDVWFTGCGGCANYYKTVLSKIKEEFKNDKRLKIISICMDKSTQLWKKSVAMNVYTSPDGLNLYTEGKGLMHPFTAEIGITGAPTIILVDQQGNIIDLDSFRLRSVELLRKSINEYIQ